MRQFDVFPNPVARLRRQLPLVVLLQSERARTGRDRVIAPMAARSSLPPLGLRLIPSVEVEGRDMGILVPGLATVAASDLRGAIANIEPARDAIIAALDYLFLGF
ncbi:MAG: CcdB family protein [Geminicoccaceae bacterium]